MAASYPTSSFLGTVARSNAERVLHVGGRRGARIDGPPRTSERIAAARMFEIWADLVHQLDAPELPLEAARHFRMEDLGLLGLVVMTAPTLLASLQSFVRFGALLNDGRTMALVLDDRTVTLELHDGAPLALGVRISHEATFAQVARGMNELAGASVRLQRVSFRHEPPRGARALRAHFACPVELGGNRDAIAFSRADLEAPRPAGNPAVFRYLSERAVEASAALAPLPIVVRVRDHVARSCRAGATPGLEAVASSLGVSGRTLRRALAAERTSFRSVVDDAKRERARELLRAPHPHSLTRVALELGFSDSSAFAHACQRWFGRTPTEVAAMLRAG